MPMLEEVTSYLHREIPLTRVMGIRLGAWDGRAVSLTAPLAPNQNHTDTAFGGSISTLGIVAGYCLVYLLFKERDISTRILVQKAATDFLRPIDHDMVATAVCPEAPLVDEFLMAVQRKRRGRLSVSSQIVCQKMLAATHSGLYVAVLY